MNVAANEGVILLHGLCRTSASMSRMANALEKNGYLVLNVDYPSRTAPVGELSEKVIGEALASEKLRDCPRVHFVTHSMGGILVRSYFAEHTDPRLGRVVMLGPPNRGSEVVDRLGSWGLFATIHGPAGRELGTGGDAIPSRLGPPGFELGVIAGDRSINWLNSLMIPGRDDGKVSVERTKVTGMKDHLVVHATHPFIMRNRRVIDATLAFLRTGLFTPLT
jgi:triacylglycerol lipase